MSCGVLQHVSRRVLDLQRTSRDFAGTLDEAQPRDRKVGARDMDGMLAPDSQPPFDDDYWSFMEAATRLARVGCLPVPFPIR